MGKQEAMTSGEHSELRLDRPAEAPDPATGPAGPEPAGSPGDTEPAAAPARPESPAASAEAAATPADPESAAASAEAAAATTGRPNRWVTWVGAMSRGRRLALTSAVAVLAVAAAIVAIGSTSSSPAKPSADPRAPAFTLARLGHSGEHISLAGMAGRPVILNFFASWCAPCQKETPLLARFYRTADGKVVLIGVDANDKTSAALKFTRAAGVSYPVAFDPYPMHTTLSYGVAALPQTFFLDARHRIVKRIFGAVTEQELRTGVALMTGHEKRG